MVSSTRHGLLETHAVACQGYWPESLLTPPDADAVERDLRAIKARRNAVFRPVLGLSPLLFGLASCVESSLFT